MANLSILTIPHPLLRKHTAAVDRVTDLERKLFSDMRETMYLGGGVGLAANQVGADKQIAVIDVGSGILTLVNPIIVDSQGTETQEEGCLSAPEIIVRVKRAKIVTVDYLDEPSGLVKRIKATGLLARVIQHEIDHLNGRMIVDHLNPLQKAFSRRRRIKS